MKTLNGKSEREDIQISVSCTKKPALVLEHRRKVRNYFIIIVIVIIIVIIDILAKYLKPKSWTKCVGDHQTGFMSARIKNTKIQIYKNIKKNKE